MDKLNPDANAGKQHEGGKALDQLVVAGGDAVGCSASGLREAVRRLEEQLGVRLLHRTTRSVAPTEVGQRLLDRLGPALTEVEAALDVVNSFRDRRPAPSGSTSRSAPRGSWNGGRMPDNSRRNRRRGATGVSDDELV